MSTNKNDDGVNLRSNSGCGWGIPLGIIIIHRRYRASALGAVSARGYISYVVNLGTWISSYLCETVKVSIIGMYHKATFVREPPFPPFMPILLQNPKPQKYQVLKPAQVPNPTHSQFLWPFPPPFHCHCQETSSSPSSSLGVYFRPCS